MFGWAIEDNKFERNPARDVKNIRYASDGFHSWDEQEIEQFEAYWPRGTKQRLAMAILLYTGARAEDAVRLGRQHRRGDEHVFVPRKTEYMKKEAVHIPVLPILEDELAAGPTGDLTYIMTGYGKPFTPKGFSQWFSRMCTRAGLPNARRTDCGKAELTFSPCVVQQIAS